MQPYFTLCVGAAASGTVYDDMSLLSRVVIDMTHVPAVRIGVFVGKPMLIILLGVGVDSYEAFWPDGAYATWYKNGVFNTHVYEITDEPNDLANHSLFFWTAVALRLPLFRLGGGRRGLGPLDAPLVHCLGWGGLGLALTFLLLTLGGLLLTLGLGGLGLAEACPDIPLVHFGGLEC